MQVMKRSIANVVFIVFLAEARDAVTNSLKASYSITFFCGRNVNEIRALAFMRSKRKITCLAAINNHSEIIRKPYMISQMFVKFFISILFNQGW